MPFGTKEGNKVSVFDAARGGGAPTASTLDLQLYSQGNRTVLIDSYGEAFFGSNVGYPTQAALQQPSTTSLAIFTRAATYNSEDFGAGDVLFGDNSSSKANMVWDASTGQLLFRTATTTKAYIDTTGAITFGGGKGTLDDTGLTFTVSSKKTVQLTTAGNFYVGSDTSAAATTALAVFGTATTWNTESMAAGALLIGDNSSSKANVKWDVTNGKLLFRSGQTTTLTINTSGVVTFDTTSGSKIRFANASDANNFFDVYADVGSGYEVLNVQSDTGTARKGFVLHADYNSASKYGQVQIDSGSGSTNPDVILKVVSGASTGLVTLGATQLTIAVGTNIQSTLDVTGTTTLAGVQCTSITNNTGLAAGTYTPTLTNVTNLDASTAYVCQYLRVGNTVTVSGRIDLDPTAGGGAASEVGVSLPVASNFTDANAIECCGTFVCNTIASECGAIFADATNDRARFLWATNSTVNRSYAFSFTYKVQ